MFKYNLIGDNDYIFDPIGTIFANRGIDDYKMFLNPKESVVNHFSLLKNINKAVQCLLKHINLNSDILIITDPDVDGYCSASIIYQYIQLINTKASVKWIIRNDKKHGAEGIDIPESVNLLILPDSGSNDFEIHKRLFDRGIDVIVLDHHEAEMESEHAIVVNPQIDNYPNKTLSGAGIVIKFCEALDEHLGVEYSTYFHDLVALGIIADSMVLSDLETRYYVKNGLSEINNDFLNALLEKQKFSTKGIVNIKNISYYIAPLINSVIRIGDLQEKKDMFKSFIGTKELIRYKPRGSSEISVLLFDDMARRCVNARGKQNRIRDKIVQCIDDHINKNNLIKNKIIFVYNIEIEEENVTGLVANIIADKYKRPTIILNKIDKDGVWKGSARGYDKGEIVNFKDIVIKSNLFEMAAGHQEAFGVKIHKDNVSKVNKVFNKLLVDYDISNSYNVDFEIKANAFKDDLIYIISELNDEWGKGFEEPYILVKDIPIKLSNIELKGQKENVILIKYNNITYIMFKTDRDTFDKINNSNTISIVGRANLNIYNEVKNPQIIIDSFYLK
ncbi:DHH family phosphoesterase [Caldifermentibacillus hisashii]|uniref:DHH family phosphoesterase n=1 Tax=Caldifermentibacillus hisashii TaxID=996558 RepID=A0ABU9K2Z5_9BACI